MHCSGIAVVHAKQLAAFAGKRCFCVLLTHTAGQRCVLVFTHLSPVSDSLLGERKH